MTPRWTAPALVQWLTGVAPLQPALSAPDDWRALADRCQALRVLPQMFHRLGAAGAVVPSPARPEFLLRRLQAVADTARVLQGGSRALHALETAGIPAAVFKGLAAVAWLHEGAPSRGVGDVDVLVAPADARAALAVLADSGFRFKVQHVTPADILRFTTTSPGSAGNHAVTVVSEDGTEVDLHWRLGTCDVPTALAEARNVRVLDRDVRAVRPGLSLLLSVHHALRNDFVPDDTIRDLLDAAGWFSWMARDGEERAWVARVASDLQLDVALEAVATVLADLGCATGRTAPSADPSAQALAELFHEQADQDAINTDLVYLCSTEPWAMFVRGLATSGRSHLRAMRAVEAANREASLALSARLHRLLAAAWHVPADRWRRLRVLAVVKARAS